MSGIWLTRGRRQGTVTSKWPGRTDDYFSSFAGSVVPIRDVDEKEADDIARICPVSAIDVTDGLTVDRGACIMCGRCVRQRPDLFAWRPGCDTSRRERQLLVADQRDDADPGAVRADLAERVRTLRRSVHIRHVDAGSDGSDEWEVRALLNPVYDVQRLGIFFTASPRHADILLVTGIGSREMVPPLRRTREAMPDPVVVIATGAEAIQGGLTGPGLGAARLLDVDVFVPGAPASPFALLHGILLALDRLRTAEHAS